MFGPDLRSTHVTFEWGMNDELKIKCSACDDKKVEVQDTAWQEVVVLYNFD